MSLSRNQIVTKLKQLPADRKIKIGDDKATMVCQWHRLADGSREHTGSFIINLVKNGRYQAGTGRCFSCSKYIGDLRIICDPALEGVAANVDDEPDEQIISLFDEKTQLMVSDEDTIMNVSSAIKWNEFEDWRGIKGKILKFIDAKLIFEEEYQNLMIYLPCVVNKQFVGGIKGNLIKKGKRNYYNQSGVWTKEVGLFPYDSALKIMKRVQASTLVLVEGPRDALRCLQFGIPAVAILGTSNYSEFKEELIVSSGAKRVITAFDGDAAGKKVTKEVYQSLRNEIDVFNFDFSKYGEDVDPGNAPMKVIRKLKRHIE